MPQWHYTGLVQILVQGVVHVRDSNPVYPCAQNFNRIGTKDTLQEKDALHIIFYVSAAPAS